MGLNLYSPPPWTLTMDGMPDPTGMLAGIPAPGGPCMPCICPPWIPWGGPSM
jgi:hypothetical protein